MTELAAQAFSPGRRTLDHIRIDGSGVRSGEFVENEVNFRKGRRLVVRAGRGDHRLMYAAAIVPAAPPDRTAQVSRKAIAVDEGDIDIGRLARGSRGEHLGGGDEQ
jgi:hypothetical protein